MMNKLRPEIQAFALLMEKRLREKDAEKGQSWKGKTMFGLSTSALAKASFMQSEIAKHQSSTFIKHAVDIANFCMMIADVAGELELPTEPVWTRDDEQTYCILYLVGGHNVSRDAIASWSDEDCQLAENWAMATHLQASDNDGIEIPPVPSCVIPFLVR